MAALLLPKRLIVLGQSNRLTAPSFLDFAEPEGSLDETKRMSLYYCDLLKHGQKEHANTTKATRKTLFKCLLMEVEEPSIRDRAPRFSDLTFLDVVSFLHH